VIRNYVLAGIGLAALGLAVWNHPNTIPPPKPKVTKVEHTAPIIKPKPIVKAVPKKRAPPSKKPRNLQNDIRRLQNCDTLNAMRKVNKKPYGEYEANLKAALVPWYVSHCTGVHN
jgi:hypothetical protein